MCNNGEENAIICWNCSKLCVCNPRVRPTDKCSSFEPLGNAISHTHIADIIGISRNQLEYVLTNYGVQKVVEMLEVRGRKVRYERIERYMRFYDLTNYKET